MDQSNSLIILYQLIRGIHPFLEPESGSPDASLDAIDAHPAIKQLLAKLLEYGKKHHLQYLYHYLSYRNEGFNDFKNPLIHNHGQKISTMFLDEENVDIQGADFSFRTEGNNCGIERVDRSAASSKPAYLESLINCHIQQIDSLHETPNALNATFINPKPIGTVFFMQQLFYTCREYRKSRHI